IQTPWGIVFGIVLWIAYKFVKGVGIYSGVGWEQRGADGAGRASSACALCIERTPDRTADAGRARTCTAGTRAGRRDRLRRCALLGHHGRVTRNPCIRHDRTDGRSPLAGADGLA